MISDDTIKGELTENFMNRLDLSHRMQVFRTVEAAAQFLQNPKIISLLPKRLVQQL